MDSQPTFMDFMTTQRHPPSHPIMYYVLIVKLSPLQTIGPIGDLGQLRGRYSPCRKKANGQKNSAQATGILNRSVCSYSNNAVYIIIFMLRQAWATYTCQTSRRMMTITGSSGHNLRSTPSNDWDSSRRKVAYLCVVLVFWACSAYTICLYFM